jgi:valyl-tRNA synthetase
MSTTSLENLPSRFDFEQAQDRIYKWWETQGYFHSEPDPRRKPFTIVIPPPNVTGALHLGHALNHTLQDIVIRFKRMQGYNTLWIPGTDHAGIATQAVVERRLREDEGKSRHDLGREKLVARIWDWKERYEARIIGQLKQVGSSCDWQRTRFTLDDVCAKAVRRTFFDLFQKKLIYRGKRLVNWDTFLQTAVSDDEVFHDAVQGHFWHFKYRVIDPQPGEPTRVTIATTRPETMLGDTAVAVHPDPAKALQALEAALREKLAVAAEKDKQAIQTQLEELEERKVRLPQLEMLRDMAIAGRELMLPLVNRKIPLIADEWAKPELGSGCVKITPAHDPNDYEVGRRAGLPMVNLLNPDGTLNSNAGPYQSKTILAARKAVVADLDKLGLLVEVEDREIDLAHSDRSKTPIEPYLADQWFVRMADLAQSAMDAVADGRVKILPTRYAKGYQDWLAEKRDWPVSRQLWWGHQIPIWSKSFDRQADLDAMVAELTAHEGLHRGRLAMDIEDQSANDRANDRANDGGLLATVHVCICDEDPTLQSQIESLGLIREEDVLDTWFSSALWPHSTLGWPENTPELQYYYPTSTLITSRDIITLWVARMVLASLNNTGKVPFHEVYIHPKILDRDGETMSKSKGNGVDPLDVINKFGADALRFGLAYLTTDTQDVRMPVQYECPHCDSLIDQTKKNRALPRLECPKCHKAFSTQWAERDEDKALPRGPVVSERFELARNFSNKLWNASRFALMNLQDYAPAPVSLDQLETEDRWILSRLSTVTEEVTRQLEAYHYADAARTLYGFAWDDFCSFYIEIAKSQLSDDAKRPVAQRVLAHVLDSLLRLLHPMIPFITEEIWSMLGKVAPARGLSDPQPACESIMIATWPQAEKRHQDMTIEQRFARFQSVLGAVRKIRKTQNIAPKTELEFRVKCDQNVAELIAPMQPYFASMANAKCTACGADVSPPPACSQISLPNIDVMVDMKDLIDVDAEIARLEKELGKLTQNATAKETKLANANFTGRAPAEIVQRERDSLAQLNNQAASVQAALGKLQSGK